MSTATTTPEFGSLREKIAFEKAERLERYRQFRILFLEAREAGLRAGIAAVPPVMIVGSPTTPLGSDIDPTKPIYVENEGPCGFAWVKVTPGTCSFARWLVKEGFGRQAYPKGVSIWIGDHGQSLARKEAHAQAMAAVLNASPLLEGVRIYAGSRMD